MNVKHLCCSCVHEDDEANPCMTVRHNDLTVRVCPLYRMSYSADLAVDAIRAVEKLVRDGKAVSGKVICFSDQVVAETVPYVQPIDILKEMKHQSELREKEER
jgi:hypothetical protein